MKKMGDSYRAKVGKRAGLIGIAVNLLLAGVKILIGTVASSVSVTADGTNNLFDATSATVTLIGFKLAEKPADKEHPYGHARFEYLASLAVSAIILFVGAELLKSSVLKLFYPETAAYSPLMVGILILSLPVKVGLAFYYKKTGKKIDSKTLTAAGEDSRNDVFMTLAVIFSIFAELTCEVKADGVMGGLVALFILYSGFRLAKDTLSPIIGEGAAPDLRKKLTAYIEEQEEVLGCHDLMVHDYGPGKRFASIHIEMDSTIEVMKSHDIIDRIEKKVAERFGIDFLVHFDPVDREDKEREKARKIVKHLLSAEDARLAFHDFRLYREEEGKRLSFDLVLPDDLLNEAEDIKERIEIGLNKSGTKVYRTDITIERNMDE